MSEFQIFDPLSKASVELNQEVDRYTARTGWRTVGILISAISGIAKIKNLTNVAYGEKLIFSAGVEGMAFDITEDEVSAILFSQSSHLKAGEEVIGSGSLMSVPVGEGVLGRVIDGMGNPLDGEESLIHEKRMPIERKAPEIIQRVPVNDPLQTGIQVIDALIPIGHGQRQLIIGDRQTGKTAIAIDTILNQKNKNVICIYCAIGQRRSSVEKIIAKLQAHGAMNYTAIVLAEGDFLPGLRFITPYAATTIAEYFRDRGEKVLIVYDDMIEHARSYREVCLLLHRPPGREAFPGDIFYIHSRLLERSTHLRPEDGGGSLTALPIVETQEQNISAYIPTNLISITDGQIYLSPELFENGIFPAIDVGNSVSRVGGLAQQKAYHDLAGKLRLAYSQYVELESFTRFGVRVDEKTYQILKHGRRIRGCLQQKESDPIEFSAQILIILALNANLLDSLPLARVPQAIVALRKAAVQTKETIDPIISNHHLSESDKETLIQIAKQALEGEAFESDSAHAQKENR